MKQFFCMRPKVVTELMQCGYHPKPCANVYDANRPAWVFDLTEDLAHDVDRIYKGIGKIPPEIILSIVNNGDTADE